MAITLKAAIELYRQDCAWASTLYGQPPNVLAFWEQFWLFIAGSSAQTEQETLLASCLYLIFKSTPVSPLPTQGELADVFGITQSAVDDCWKHLRHRYMAYLADKRETATYKVIHNSIEFRVPLLYSFDSRSLLIETRTNSDEKERPRIRRKTDGKDVTDEQPQAGETYLLEMVPVAQIFHED
jgi:hypothetical protein